MASRYSDWADSVPVDSGVMDELHRLLSVPFDPNKHQSIWVAVLAEIAWMYGASEDESLEIASAIWAEMADRTIDPVTTVQAIVETRQRALRGGSDPRIKSSEN